MPFKQVPTGWSSRSSCATFEPWKRRGRYETIVTYPPTRYRGTIALQVYNYPEIIPQLMIRLTTYIASHPTMEEYKGKLFIVEAHCIRIRE